MRVITTLRAGKKIPLTWRGRWSGGRVLPPGKKGAWTRINYFSNPPAGPLSKGATARPGKEAELLNYTGGRVRGLEGRVAVWRTLGSALLGPEFLWE